MIPRVSDIFDALDGAGYRPRFSRSSAVDSGSGYRSRGWVDIYRARAAEAETRVGVGPVVRNLISGGR